MKRPLSESQIRGIIEGIVAGRTHKEIAAAIGVHQQTVAKYSCKPDIREAVEERKKEAIAKKVEVYSQINASEDAEQWVAAIRKHREDMLKTAKTLRVGGMTSMNKALAEIQKYNMAEAKLSELVSLVRVGHELAAASYELEASALGIYELTERVSERSKELEG